MWFEYKTLIDTQSLFVPDIARKFLARCAQIYEGTEYRVIRFVCIDRTVMTKICRKSRCKGDLRDYH